MKSDSLAINGGKPLINKPFPPYKSLGDEEIKAAHRVLKSGVLSAFIGASGPAFYGGPEVQKLEQEAASFFKVKHVVSFNSWTSGLIASMGAIGLEPGDEVLTSPWTMAATATSILHWNAIPVFVDISPETFNLDPQQIESAITSRTRAILCPDIFGLGADFTSLKLLADKYKLKLIMDTAQSPGALIEGNYAGTIGDIGGFSLNYHKHIHCGEGGLAATNDDKLAERMKLIRNHGEAVIESSEASELSNIIGYNFRLGEIEAAIAREQIKKLPKLVLTRQEAAKNLFEGLADLPGIKLPNVQSGMTHVYYIFGIILDLNRLDKDRNWIMNALKAEGVPALIAGYQNIHLNPIFKYRIAYGKSGFPWNGLSDKTSNINYFKGICPIAEDLHDRSFIGLLLCTHNFTAMEIDLVIKAFRKVWSHIQSDK